MNKNRYLSQLKKELRLLPKPERQNVLQEIEGLINDSGCEDSELQERFGSPQELASRYLGENTVSKPSLMERTTTLFAWFIGALVAIMLVGGIFVYFNFVDDQFDYADESHPELDMDQPTWIRFSPEEEVTLNITQSSVVIYWTEENVVAFKCESGVTNPESSVFTIEQDRCLMYLPDVPARLNTRQTQLVLIRPQADATLDIDQTHLRIADNGAPFSLTINKQETRVGDIPAQESADTAITITSRQSSIMPYRF